jgi:hypothetical protein
MTLSLQEISDRLELQDLVTRYADIIDRKAFAELSTIFTDNAVIDYEATGAPKCSVQEMVTFLDEAMSLFPNHQHLVSNTHFKVNGDTATGRVMCFNPMEMAVEGGTQTFILGIWYVDEFVRVDDRWLFTSRKQEASWNLNFPDELRPT